MIPFGPNALRFALPPGVPRARVHRALVADPRVVDVVLAETEGVVVVASPSDATRRDLAQLLAELSSNADEANEASSLTARARATRDHVVRVVYDGDDLATVAQTIGATVDDVIALHADGRYEVAMMGFLPGFAYLRAVDPRLVLPRRATPRARVPAASVAIAAHYTGIYPFASPGGWHLLGRALDFTPLGADAPTFALGDRVRFVPALATETRASAGAGAPSAASPPGVDGRGDAKLAPATPPDLANGLEVVRANGIALVVDGGRRGHMVAGIPHGGPLVGGAHRRANVAVGNADDDAAIEIYGTFTFRARGDVTVADDEGTALSLTDGATFTVSTEGKSRVRYVAARGGVDVDVVLGSRTTLLVARLGGLDGRVLRRGDVLPIGAPPRADEDPAVERARVEDGGEDRHLHSPRAANAPIALLEGPDAVPGFPFTRMLDETWTIMAQSDRTGTRLRGLTGSGTESSPADVARPSSPMVAGAVELTPDGPIVLGPDHPVTGGYPVIAFVPEKARDSLFARPLGTSVRFVRRATSTDVG